MRFLIAGLGSIGRRHLKNLLKLGQKDIYLFRSKLSTLPDEELDGFPMEVDLQRSLAAKPDAVIISNPTALHLDVRYFLKNRFPIIWIEFQNWKRR